MSLILMNEFTLPHDFHIKRQYYYHTHTNLHQHQNVHGLPTIIKNK